MGSDKETAYYIELQPGDKVQVWDQWLDQFGQWQFYTCTGNTEGVVGYGVKARRPIGKTNQTVFKEVPGSRTTQETVIDPQRERIAYEELQPGDIIQEGDEWQNECGRWKPFLVLDGSRVQVRQSQRVRRPYNITQMENDRAEAIAECAKWSTELWARKPLEERVSSLTEELANAREDFRKLVKTNVQNTNDFAEHTAALAQERDEARAERDKLKGLIDDLLDEPSAKQVQDMLRTWATELDWSAGCFDSVGREQIDTIQKTLVAVIERIEGMIHPEGSTDGE